jgi:DNA polymerase V
MSKSLNSGQVLQSPYTYKKARIVLEEMCDGLVLDLVSNGIATNQIVITVGYDAESLTSPSIAYSGEVTVDHYGRQIPKHAHGTENLKMHSSSTEEIVKAALSLYDRIVDKNLLIRRLNVSVNNIQSESIRKQEGTAEQLDFFTDYGKAEKEKKAAEQEYEKEKQKQNALICIRKRYGGNAILRGISFSDGATAIERNEQIGGHKA